MPKIYDKQSGQALGALSAVELQFLADRLEEESSTDQDYYIDVDTVERLVEEGAPAALVALLRTALGGREDCEIRWELDP